MDGGSLRKGLAGSMWPLTPDYSTINYHEYISASVKAALNLLRTANLKMLGNWTDFLHRGPQGGGRGRFSCGVKLDLQLQLQR